MSQIGPQVGLCAFSPLTSLIPHSSHHTVVSNFQFCDAVIAYIVVVFAAVQLFNCSDVEMLSSCPIADLLPTPIRAKTKTKL